jgi:hypothetical protein
MRPAETRVNRLSEARHSPAAIAFMYAPMISAARSPPDRRRTLGNPPVGATGRLLRREGRGVPSRSRLGLEADGYGVSGAAGG